MCEADNIRFDFSEDKLEFQSWFLKKVEDPESRKMIFSTASLKKMAEFKSGLEWGKWLKSVFEEAEAAGIEMVEREIQRGLQLKKQETPALGDRDKWRVRIRCILNHTRYVQVFFQSGIRPLIGSN